MVDIMKTFNISSTLSTIPNQNTATDEIESSNLDSDVIAADSVSKDKRSQVATTTNSKAKDSNLAIAVKRIRSCYSSDSKLR